jgi:hypothetical protein
MHVQSIVEALQAFIPNRKSNECSLKHFIIMRNKIGRQTFRLNLSRTVMPHLLKFHFTIILQMIQTLDCGSFELFQRRTAHVARQRMTTTTRFLGRILRSLDVLFNNFNKWISFSDENSKSERKIYNKNQLPNIKNFMFMNLNKIS